MVTIAMPVRPATVLAVTVRAAPLPAKAMLAVGSSVELEEVALSVSVALSTSPTVSLIVPERSSVPQVPPAATVTVGVSLTGVTLSVTVATGEVSAPSLAR